MKIILSILGFVMLNLSIVAGQQKAFYIKIDEEISIQTDRYLKLALEEAEKEKTDFVLLELNTFGGALDAADQIRTKLLDFPQPVYVFINKNAASAGALISISCDSIYMSKGANIGAATVVNESGVPLPDKYQSYMRSLMRSTAEANGRDADKAAQMVGRLTGVDSTTIANVLSYSTKEAIENNFCEAQVDNIDDVIKRITAKDVTIIKYEHPMIERVIGFFLSPYLRGILILIMIAGIYYEMSAPGIGFALLASVTAALLYFIPSYLNGLAENWEILLFVLGLALIAAEIFILPGFGVAGIAGGAVVIVSLVLVMVNNRALDFTFVNGLAVTQAISIALLSTLAAGIVALMLGDKLFRRIALTETQQTDQGYTSNFIAKDMKGKIGVAHTVLRPSGKIMIDNEVYDAYSTGEFIEKGNQIIVVDHMATGIKVKKSS